MGYLFFKKFSYVWLCLGQRDFHVVIKESWCPVFKMIFEIYIEREREIEKEGRRES